jgi:hypothetical protein
LIKFTPHYSFLSPLPPFFTHFNEFHYSILIHAYKVLWSYSPPITLSFHLYLCWYPSPIAPFYIHIIVLGLAFTYKRKRDICLSESQVFHLTWWYTVSCILMYAWKLYLNIIYSKMKKAVNTKWSQLTKCWSATLIRWINVSFLLFLPKVTYWKGISNGRNHILMEHTRSLKSIHNWTGLKLELQSI